MCGGPGPVDVRAGHQRVRYGARPEDFELVQWPADGHYWIAVSDPGFGKPELPTAPDLNAEGGRGLMLVDALSAAWGVVPGRVRGKRMVAGVRLDAG